MRILFVEDSAPLRKPVVKALKASGFAVDATGDGAEAWQMAQDHDYDVIVLDIMLPGMDGREVLKRLRERKRRCFFSRRRIPSKIAWPDCGWALMTIL